MNWRCSDSSLPKLVSINEHHKDIPYANIRKAYGRMLKAYQGVDEITNTEDLRRYARQTDAYIEMQEAFLKLIASDYASSSDSQLKKETDVERIKTVIGLD